MSLKVRLQNQQKQSRETLTGKKTLMNVYEISEQSSLLEKAIQQQVNESNLPDINLTNNNYSYTVKQEKARLNDLKKQYQMLKSAQNQTNKGSEIPKSIKNAKYNAKGYLNQDYVKLHSISPSIKVSNKKQTVYDVYAPHPMHPMMEVMNQKRNYKMPSPMVYNLSTKKQKGRSKYHLL